MTHFLSILICLLFSALFSGLEIAFLSSNKLQIEIDAKKGKVSAHIISIFLKRPNLFITTLLIGNNIALVIYGLTTALVLEPFITQIVSSQILIILIQTLISTIVIIFTAEFLPKVIFQIYANTTIRFFSFPMLLIYIVLYPITIIVNLFSRFFLLFTNLKNSNIKNIKGFGKIDLVHFLSDNSPETKPAVTDKNNFKIFLNALEFSSVKLRECVRPRTELISVNVQDNIETLIPKFAESGYSKIPVYKHSIDTIIGYVHSSDMLKNPESIKSILREIPFAPETMSAKKMLTQFINEKQSIAVVVDEFGGTEGIVTIEDIIEEIFGEIRDEHDHIELEERKINDFEFVFAGRQEIDHINEAYQLTIPESEEYETLAGFFLYYYEKFPQVNATKTIKDLKLTVLKISGTRIELIHIKKLQDTH